jgi:hypothetical protein
MTREESLALLELTTLPKKSCYNFLGLAEDFSIFIGSHCKMKKFLYVSSSKIEF